MAFLMARQEGYQQGYLHIRSYSDCRMDVCVSTYCLELFNMIVLFKDMFHTKLLWRSLLLFS